MCVRARARERAIKTPQDIKCTLMLCLVGAKREGWETGGEKIGIFHSLVEERKWRERKTGG